MPSFADKPARNNVLQSLKLICTYTNHSQPASFKEAVELFAAARTPHLIEFAAGQLSAELTRFFTVYCSSAPTDFSIVPVGWVVLSLVRNRRPPSRALGRSGSCSSARTSASS